MLSISRGDSLLEMERLSRQDVSLELLADGLQRSHKKSMAMYGC